MTIQLYKGDCLEIMKQLIDEGVKVDAIITDIPYGTTACSWDSVIPFEPMWDCIEKLRKEKTSVVLFGQEPFSSNLRVSNLKNYKYDWIWEKQKASNFMAMKHQPAKYHELLSVFYPHNYYPIMWVTDNKDNRKTVNNNRTNKDCHLGSVNRIRNADNGLRYPKSIIKINKSINGNVHPTQKPVALMEYLVKTYTNEGDTVLDFTMGSGTTGVACKNLNRNFIGIELDNKYFKIAKQRIDEALKC